jgi:hypothetical protein
MKIIVFAATSAKRNNVLLAIGRSAKRHGLNCEIVYSFRYQACDVAVVWGLPKSKTVNRELSKKKAECRQEIFGNHQGQFIVLEAPVLGRRVSPRFKRSRLAKTLLPSRAPWTRLFLPESSYRPDPFSHYRVGLGGFPDQGGLALAQFCDGRWDLLAKRLAMPDVLPYRTAGRHIVVVGQVPGDTSLRGEDINDWLLNTCAKLRRLSNRPIVARLHPLVRSHEVAGMHDRLEELSVEIDDPSRPFSQTLRDAWSVVTYSSGAAVDALIAGVPAIAMGRASFAWEVTDHDLENAVDPKLFDRRQWLGKLAAAHWCIDEIARGEIWQPLLGALSAGSGAESSHLAESKLELP